MKEYKIKTILVPTDFSETANNALRRAIEITMKINGKLVLAHVVETSADMSPQTALIARTSIMALGIYEQIMEASVKKLKKLAVEIREEYGIPVEYKSYSGNIYDNIIRSAHLFDADLIVMGTHGTSGLKEWLFGSNAFSVVNNTTIPVLTINLHSDTNTFKKIVFPFNENLLTLQKIEQAIAFAKIYNSSILVFGFTNSKMTSAMTALREKGEELAKRFAEENINSSFAMNLGEDYAEEILKYANSEKADMITIVTNRSHNVDNVFKTKPDKKLVNHSEIPVLSVPVE